MVNLTKFIVLGKFNSFTFAIVVHYKIVLSMNFHYECVYMAYRHIYPNVKNGPQLITFVVVYIPAVESTLKFVIKLCNLIKKLRVFNMILFENFVGSTTFTITIAPLLHILASQHYEN